MKRKINLFYIFICICFYAKAQSGENLNKVPNDFDNLFNGLDFTNWIVPDGDNGHWKILNGVIDYDAESEASGDKHLWTEKEFEDFILYVDWRIKETPYKNSRVPIILPSGEHKLDENGEEIKMVVPDSDSGILFRCKENTKVNQVNIWCWPIGSGEVYSYRMNKSMPAEVRRGVTPKYNADNNIGEWNTFRIMVRDNILNVELNGHIVIENAELPGLPYKGAIGLQHHGGKVNEKWTGPPSLVQFRNIYIKEI